MKKQLAVFIFLLWSVGAGEALASVRISEIAWMGTAVSGSNEWIELANDASTPVDLSGWHIEAEDGSPNILLSGSIAANGYYLIERTDDTTVPNIPADLVAAFGNGLSNSGETLKLKDAGGLVIDTVIGGADWANIGGDNATKKTAQRLLPGDTWITATGTPRAAPASSGEVLGASTTTSSMNNAEANGAAATAPSAGSSGGTSRSAYPSSVYPRKEITVLAGADAHVFAGFPAPFSGTALGLYDEPLPYATYRWNFGDGAASEGKNATHSYRFPGEYIVTLTAVWGSLVNADRLTVFVTSPDVAIARLASGSDGFIELANHSGREIDLSGWSLRASSSASMFMFSANTVIPSGRSVMFANEITKLSATGTIELVRPNGTRAYVYGEDPKPATGIVKGAMTSNTTEPAASVAPSHREQSVTENVFAAKDVRKAAREAVLIAASDTAATVLWERGGGAPLIAQSASANTMKWFFALTGLMLIAIAGYMLLRKRTGEMMIGNEYTIVEDIIEREIKE